MLFEKLKALAEPHRIEILRLVHHRELPAGAIAEHFDATRPAISQHLRVLSNAGLITERREGTKRFYRLDPQGFAEVREFLSQFWDERLMTLKHAAEQSHRERHGRKRTGT